MQRLRHGPTNCWPRKGLFKAIARYFVQKYVAVQSGGPKYLESLKARNGIERATRNFEFSACLLFHRAPLSRCSAGSLQAVCWICKPCGYRRFPVALPLRGTLTSSPLERRPNASGRNGRSRARLCENVKSAVRAKTSSHSNLATLEPMTSGFHFCRNLHPLGDMWSHHKNLDASFHTASTRSGHRHNPEADVQLGVSGRLSKR